MNKARTTLNLELIKYAYCTLPFEVAFVLWFFFELIFYDARWARDRMILELQNATS